MRKLIIAFILSVIAISKTPIKGIWLTVSGTDAPYSEQGIIDVVRKCEYLGINTIYFAVWNRLMINYTPKD